MIEEVTLFDLIEAFRQVVERSTSVQNLEITKEPVPIEDKVGKIIDLLTERENLFMHELFGESTNRPDIILTFIAVLDLVRLKVIRIFQEFGGGPIRCQITERFSGQNENREQLLFARLKG